MVGENRLVTIANVGTLNFGPGALLRCASDLIDLNKRSVFIVTTPPTLFLCAPLIDALRAADLTVTVWDDLVGEPTMREFGLALAAAQTCGADAVVGLGGGSAMDVAKLVAALADGKQDFADVIDTYALAGIALIAANIERACRDGSDLEARSAMMRASLYGGLCLGPVNTAAVHALAYPLGGEFHIAHGVANALLLPHVLRFNIEATPQRYAEIARALGATCTGDHAADALAGVERVIALADACGIKRRLSDFGIPRDAIPRMAVAAMTVTRLLVLNPRTVTEADARTIYEAAW